MSDNPVRPIDLATHSYGVGQAPFDVPIDWPEQNRRRFELISKRRHHGLSDEEQVEYDSLQALADEIVDALSPPLMFTAAERAYIGSKAGH